MVAHHGGTFCETLKKYTFPQVEELLLYCGVITRFQTINNKNKCKCKRINKMETSEESNLESNKIHVFPIKKSSTRAPVVVQEAR